MELLAPILRFSSLLWYLVFALPKPCWERSEQLRLSLCSRRTCRKPSKTALFLVRKSCNTTTEENTNTGAGTIMNLAMRISHKQKLHPPRILFILSYFFHISLINENSTTPTKLGISFALSIKSIIGSLNCSSIIYFDDQSLIFSINLFQNIIFILDYYSIFLFNLINQYLNFLICKNFFRQ